MILLHSHTKVQLERILDQPSHGLLFTGPAGAGKAHVARFAAAKLLNVDFENITNYPHIKNVAPESRTITIGQIRELQRFLQLRTPGKSRVRRVIIIEDAHYMTSEAQNALLKSLEEPPADTVLILTALMSLKLKDTIYSRVQLLSVLAPSKAEAKAYFKNYSPAEIERTYAMSGGNAGLMNALLTQTDHELANQVLTAKEIFGSTVYERLLRVDSLSKQKENLPSLLYALKLISSTALHQAAIKQNQKQIKRWHASLEAIYQAEATLDSSPNTKLLLTNLFMNL